MKEQFNLTALDASYKIDAQVVFEMLLTAPMQNFHLQAWALKSTSN